MERVSVSSFDPRAVGLVAAAVCAVLLLCGLSVSQGQDVGEASDVDREFGAPVRVVGAADRAVEDADECVSTRGGLVLCVLDDVSGARVVRVVGMERGI